MSHLFSQTLLTLHTYFTPQVRLQDVDKFLSCRISIHCYKFMCNLLSLFFPRILPASKEARVSVGSETSIASFTGLNRYFVLCTTESLAFGGGGHFALHIDAEL